MLLALGYLIKLSKFTEEKNLFDSNKFTLCLLE